MTVKEPPSHEYPIFATDGNSRTLAILQDEFQQLARHRLPKSTAQSLFESLWDEVNRGAMTVMQTQMMTEYVSLLRAMQQWYEKELKR